MLFSIVCTQLLFDFDSTLMRFVWDEHGYLKLQHPMFVVTDTFLLA